jgi:hypothetical protein
MINFIKNHYKLTILFTFLICVGCDSVADTPPVATTPPQKISADNTDAASSSREESANDETDKAVVNQQEKPSEQISSLNDGSQYIMMRDAYGNTTEMRYFEESDPVKSISVRTFADGSKTTVVRTWEGSIKRIKPQLITDPWRSSVRDIAVLAGISPTYHPTPKGRFTPTVSNSVQNPAKPVKQPEKTIPEQTPQPAVETPSNQTNNNVKP